MKNAENEYKKVDESYFSVSIKNWPFYAGILLILIGIVASISIEAKSFFPKLLILLITELGFAFFISHIIIITVDQKEKEILRNEIIEIQNKLEFERQSSERRILSKLYLSAILKVDLPVNLSEELEKYIISSKLIKKEQNITYVLNPIGPYVLLKQKHDAVYENVYKGIYEYNPTFQSYDNVIPEIEDRFPDINWGLESISIHFIAAGKTKEEKLLEWFYRLNITNKDEIKFDRDTVHLHKPIKLHFGDRIRLRIEWNMPKFASDNEIFTNLQFSEKLNLDIQYDKKIFELGYRCIHPRASECMQVTNGSSTDYVRFEYPFLPSNGVIAWWRRKNTGKID